MTLTLITNPPSEGALSISGLLFRNRSDVFFRDHDVVDEDVILAGGGVFAAVVEVDPDGLNLEFGSIAHAHVGLFEGRFPIDPGPENSVAFADRIEFGVLLDAVPAVVFEEAEIVFIPEPIVAVLPLHFGVVAIKTDRGFAVFSPCEKSAGRPAVGAITGSTTPAALSVSAADPGELPAADGVPVVAETQVVAELNFGGLAVFGFGKRELNARSIVVAFWGGDGESLAVQRLEFSGGIFGDDGNSFALSAVPFFQPTFVLKIDNFEDVGVISQAGVIRMIGGETFFLGVHRRKGGKQAKKEKRVAERKHDFTTSLRGNLIRESQSCDGILNLDRWFE